jgi:hypothetical protein
MNTEPDANDGTHFIRPRIVAGVGIYALVAVLALWDATHVEYALDSIALGLMLGTGGVLLGVEPLRRLLK